MSDTSQINENALPTLQDAITVSNENEQNKHEEQIKIDDNDITDNNNDQQTQENIENDIPEVAHCHQHVHEHHNENSEYNVQHNMDNQLHHHQCHHHQQLPSYYKWIVPLGTILGMIRYADQYVSTLVDSLANSFDIIIASSNFHFIIKRILHSKQLLFFIFLVNTHYLMTSVNNPNFLYLAITFSLYLMLLFISILIIHDIVDKTKFLSPDEELEKYITSINPELKNSKCEKCEVIKTMRSVHCPICNRCIKKFNFHSNWFNLCVGSSNELLYFITFSFVIVYLTWGLLTLIYDIFLSSLCDGNQFNFHLWFIIFIYVYYKGISFSIDISKNILNNITQYERFNQKRLNYLFKDLSKRYYNPFNNGYTSNIYELLINMVSCYNKNKRMEIKGNIPLPTVDEESALNESKNNQVQQEQNVPGMVPFGDITAYRMFIKLGDGYSPFISSQGNVVKRVDQGEIINWNFTRMYTVFDLIHSPFAQILIKNAKYELENYEKVVQMRNAQLFQMINRKSN